MTTSTGVHLTPQLKQFPPLPSFSPLPDTLPRISYDEALASYGSDKPDRRIGMRIHNVTHGPGLASSTFEPVAAAARGTAGSAGVVGVINAQRLSAALSRKQLDALLAELKGHTESAAAQGAVLPVKVGKGGAWPTGVAKHFGDEAQVRGCVSIHRRGDGTWCPDTRVPRVACLRR